MNEGENAGFDFGTVIDQIKQVITDPVGFFKAMPKSGGYAEPLIFLLVAAAIGGVVVAVLSIIGLTPGPGFVGVAAIIAFPIGALIGGFIGAAILFVIWKLMGSPEDYETAYRCVAYMGALMPVFAVLMVIPYIGTIIRVLWTTWLLIIQSVEVHGRAKQTAQLVFGILGALGILFGLSSEYTQRQLVSQSEQVLENFNEAQSRALENLEDMTPEEMGQAMGEFLKGMEEAAKQQEGNN